MPDAVAALESRPSLARRIADRWRAARAAALIRTLPHGEVGLDLPDPARVAPRVHATLEGLAHPAVWEVGIPGVAMLAAAIVLRGGWDAYWPRLPEQRILFALLHPVWIAAVTAMGKTLLRRRYARLAREAYNRALWRVADVKTGAALVAPIDA